MNVSCLLRSYKVKAVSLSNKYPTWQKKSCTAPKGNIGLNIDTTRTHFRSINLTIVIQLEGECSSLFLGFELQSSQCESVKQCPHVASRVGTDGVYCDFRCDCNYKSCNFSSLLLDTNAKVEWEACEMAVTYLQVRLVWKEILQGTDISVEHCPFYSRVRIQEGCSLGLEGTTNRAWVANKR